MYKVINEDLNQQVYNTIRGMILSGELVPNQKLVQEDLALRLQVSRTPLLSAFAKLEREMLLTSIPRRGYYVRSVNLDELLQIYEIRLRLEPLGAREAAFDAHEQEILDLLHTTDSLAELDDDALNEQFRSYDYEFHSTIMNLSKNPFLEKMVSSFNLVTLGNLTGMLRNVRDSLSEHKAILLSIMAHDQDKAEQAMFRHVEVAKKRIEQYVSEKECS
jgi:DNA-binding GntR family transcriptional regulator